jgi:hypothetical protein
MFSNIEWLHIPLAEEEPRTDEEIRQLTIEELIDQRFEQITPVFNREGWYYDRLKKFSWYEWSGTAWKAEVSQFVWELDQHNAKLLEPAEVKAIKTLIVYGSCNLALKQLLWDHSHKSMHRAICRNGRLEGLRFKKEYEKLCK